MPTIIFNGQSYSRVEDMPADVRQAYEGAVGMLAGQAPAGQNAPSAGPQPSFMTSVRPLLGLNWKMLRH